jgi:hypothetical protein
VSAPGDSSEWPRLVGACIAEIYRVHWCRHGRVDREEGPLGFVFADGRAVHFTGQADGATLRVEIGAWVDPLGEPRTADAQRYAEEVGEWKRIDVSAEPRYRAFVGATISGIEPLLDEDGIIAGLALHAAGAFLCFVVRFDEDHVFWELPDGFRTTGSAS